MKYRLIYIYIKNKIKQYYPKILNNFNNSFDEYRQGFYLQYKDYVDNQRPKE